MMSAIHLGDHSLEYRQPGPVAGDRPVIVFLHEGLGSARLWRDFPDALCARAGCGGLVYSRRGYGASDPPAAARGADYLHREALEALPALMRALGIARPVLLGHSDGASIALIHAAGGHAVAGLVLMAPHVFVEEVTLAGIRAAKRAWDGTDLPQRLARHHADAHRVFHDWHDTWTSPGFRDWNIEAGLPAIEAPMLVLQGEDDEYGTAAQLEAIARQAGGGCETRLLAACGHAPHRDRRDEVIDAAARFIAALA
jgi:pimeloyl-ACP methyl ester carboxylesterase